MSIDYYSNATSDWEAACVASAGMFKSYGAGAWGIQFRSPSVCPKPVLFTFAGAGLGFGAGASASESSLNTSSERQKSRKYGPTLYTGFTKLECEIPFSLFDLNSAGGRLSVCEGYIAGIGGGVVIISAFRFGKDYFNSQNLWGSGVAPTKMGGTLAVTGGVWKSEFLGKMVPSRSGSSRNSAANDVCSIYDLPKSAAGQSVHRFQKQTTGPTIHN